jgi:hypothetical protein
MDIFWNKRLSIVKFPIIFIAMLPKFFYSHTFKSQVLQWFFGFIFLKTIIKFPHYSLRIFAWFIHNDILLLRSIWWILNRSDSVRRRLWRMNMWRRMMMKSLFSWWILKRRGSVRMRVWRMNMWRRMMMKSLFNWWILKRIGSVRRRLRRMNMWRRMLLRSLFSWWILKRRGSVRRLHKMNMWRRTMPRSFFSWLILRRGSVRRL